MCASSSLHPTPPHPTPLALAQGQCFIFLAFIFLCPIGALVLIPFFHSLELTTAYTYFELRFGRVHRTIASILFLSRVCCYLGVVLYAPALLLHTCLAFPLWATILFTGCLSTLWTVKGGMFAVVCKRSPAHAPTRCARYLFVRSAKLIRCACAQTPTRSSPSP